MTTLPAAGPGPRGRARSPPRTPPLPGRTPAAASVREPLALARRGRGGSVLILGEAGIGKSRSIRETVLDAPRSAGDVVLVGRGSPWAASRCGTPRCWTCCVRPARGASPSPPITDRATLATVSSAWSTRSRPQGHVVPHLMAELRQARLTRSCSCHASARSMRRR